MRNIAARSVVVLIKHQGIGDVLRICALAQRDNVDFRLAFIAPEFDVELKEPFDQNYMSALYDLAYEIGRSGAFWLEKPPRSDTLIRLGWLEWASPNCRAGPQVQTCTKGDGDEPRS